MNDHLARVLRRRATRHRPRVTVHGSISSAGFEAGHRFVVGHWLRSPIGPIVDVMWATPSGERILLVDNRAAADFITSIYEFDAINIGPLVVLARDQVVRVSGQGCELELVGGRRRPIPLRRPLAVTRHIEAPIARALMGVETFGMSPTGAREWYQARSWRWLISARASIDGCDLGALRPVQPPIGVGFSEPPRRPSIVTVKVTIELASSPRGQ